MIELRLFRYDGQSRPADLQYDTPIGLRRASYAYLEFVLGSKASGRLWIEDQQK